MTHEVDSATKRRLVYIRKLYLHGHEHIPNQTEFDRMIAIHHFDNAVELLLKCAATELGLSFRHPFIQFPQLWEAVNERQPLSKKTEIFQLHDLRSNVQHLGISPFSTEIVDRFDVYVLDFLRETLKRIFGLNFDELFMSSLVEDRKLKKMLAIAEEAFEKEDYVKCMRYADAAFSEAFWRKRDEFRIRVPSISTPDSEMEEFLEELTGIVSIAMLGIDYMTFHKHEQISTGAMWSDKEDTVTYPQPLFEGLGGKEDKPDNRLYSKENALFSLNFAVDCILHWHF